MSSMVDVPSSEAHQRFFLLEKLLKSDLITHINWDDILSLENDNKFDISRNAQIDFVMSQHQHNSSDHNVLSNVSATSTTNDIIWFRHQHESWASIACPARKGIANSRAYSRITRTL
jgi:hypothetical protein